MSTSINELHVTDNTKGNDMVYVCAHCGQVFEDDYCLESVTLADGTVELWCDECVDQDAHICDHCNELHENAVRFTDVRVHYWRAEYEEWCPACVDNDAHQCSDCGELFGDGYIDEVELWDGDERYICENCLDDNYHRCYYCDRWVHDDDATYRDWECYCPDHVPSANVQDYHHTRGSNLTYWLRNDLKKYGWELDSTENRTLFLGVELETDGNDDKGDLADDIMSEYTERHVECKEDGSLDEEGLEIVSMPMTPEVQLTMGMWERITEIVRNHGGCSHDAGTCGLHIHISRSFFNDHDAVYRMDRIFHRFERQFMNFSRRHSDQMGWCRIKDHSDLEAIEDLKVRKQEWAYKKGCDHDRYEAVNDTNSATVEIRLWRGSLNVETIRATIEFTAGLAIVCNTMSDELAEGLTWNMLKLLVRYALEAEGLPHNDLDAYIARRSL